MMYLERQITTSTASDMASGCSGGLEESLSHRRRDFRKEADGTPLVLQRHMLSPSAAYAESRGANVFH